MRSGRAGVLLFEQGGGEFGSGHRLVIEPTLDLVAAGQAQGREVVTIEGLSDQGTLHPVQQAFIDHDAYQCGFCTAGQIMSCVALLRENASPTAEDVLRAVSGNLCRCGAYPNIVAAALAASKKRTVR